MSDNVRLLISASEIACAVDALGAQLTEECRGRDLAVLGVLTGSIVFVADLMRRIRVPHELGLIQASSYRGTATRPGELQLQLDSLPDLTDRDVLLVDDIFDTGRTLSAIIDQLGRRRPRSVRSAVLLWKTARAEVSLRPDYFCFEIPDAFVVGYGLDYNGQHRHLPYIGVIKNDLASGAFPET